MKDLYLFLDYLWDLQPNYFDMKADNADIAFNRKLLCHEEIDDIFLFHLNKNNIFIDKPIINGELFIGLTKKGGKIWEDIYNINWNNYLYFEVNEIKSKQEVSIYSQNKNILFEIFPEIKNQSVSKLECWNVTYWKKLTDVFVNKLYFDQDDDADLWDRFHKSALPKWREKLG